MSTPLLRDSTFAPMDGAPWTDGPRGWPGYSVVRGAAWVNPPVLCRSAFRFGSIPIYKRSTFHRDIEGNLAQNSQPY